MTTPAVDRCARALLLELARPKADPQEDLAALVAEAATEIDNLDGPNNVVAQRLWAYMRRVDAGEVVVTQKGVAEDSDCRRGAGGVNPFQGGKQDACFHPA